MAHENSHDGQHGHDDTEGNRQYYPKGWYIPLIGLVVVAFFISLGAGALLGISGTDKWGKTEEHADGDHHDGTHMEGDHHDGDHHDAHGSTPAADTHHNDSANVTAGADTAKGDSAKPAEHQH